MGSLQGPRVPAVALVLAAGCLVGLLAGSAAPSAVQQSAPALPDAALQASSLLRGNLPVIAERRYRLAGKVRWLLFWAGKDDVGGARVRWRRRDGDVGYDLLVGSDPARTPRKINRWGFIMEETSGPTASIVGVMKKGQEETLEEARKNVSAEAAGGVAFDMIRATVDASESVAHVTTATVGRDYSYRELDALLVRLIEEPSPPTVRKVAMAPQGRQGFLLSVADLLHSGAETVRTTSKNPRPARLSYAYYRKQYDLSRVSSEIETQESYGGVRYPRLVRSQFEVRARGEDWTERFTIVYGVDGAIAEVPVFVSYQPRWWFKIELVLDERQAF